MTCLGPRIQPSFHMQAMGSAKLIISSLNSAQYSAPRIQSPQVPSATTTDKPPRRCSGDPGSKQAFQDLGLRELDVVRMLRSPCSPQSAHVRCLRHGAACVAHYSLYLQEWQVPRVRVRQHVNPFKTSLQIKHGPLQWAEEFKDPLAPLIVDVGCGYGRFPLHLAKSHPQFNTLGLEIRAPPVDRAKRWAQGLNVQERVAFAVANATLSMKSMLEWYPGKVVLISIQFPDPHFKRKHQKRHTVQPQFCSEVAEVLCPGGLVFVQSDVEDVINYMRSTFQDSEPQRLAETIDVADIDLHDPEQLLRPRACCVSVTEGSHRLASNPLWLPTEREVHSVDKGKEVYRFMLQKVW